MPQITVKGLTEAQMKKLSTPLMHDLAEAIGCPEDWLIFELAESRFYAGGEQVPGFPIVEVAWFDRPDEVRERVVALIRDAVLGPISRMRGRLQGRKTAAEICGSLTGWMEELGLIAQVQARSAAFSAQNMPERAEEERLKEKAKELEVKIEPRLLTSFKRIRKNARNGLGIVYVQRDACGGCFNKIPPQRQLDIRMHKKIIVCEYCGRILIDPELAGVKADKQAEDKPKRKRAIRKRTVRKDEDDDFIPEEKLS